MTVKAILISHASACADAVTPFMAWTSHGHQWAVPFGLLAFTLLLLWPLFALMVPLAVWARIDMHYAAKADRRERHRALNLRGAR